jgi:predicted nucleotidyltransferase
VSPEQLPEAWRRSIQQWAKQKDSIQEVWLFGSRARGEATAKKDVDIAITLIPPKGNHNWALGNYERFGDDWQRELSELVGRSVDLALKMGLPPKADTEAVLIWKRES